MRLAIVRRLDIGVESVYKVLADTNVREGVTRAPASTTSKNGDHPFPGPLPPFSRDRTCDSLRTDRQSGRTAFPSPSGAIGHGPSNILPRRKPWPSYFPLPWCAAGGSLSSVK